MTENKRAERAKALRYKRPIAANLNLWQIRQDLEEMQETCYDIQWYVDSTDEETMIANMDGDEDEAYEFKMAFSDLEAGLLKFQEDLQNGLPDHFMISVRCGFQSRTLLFPCAAAGRRFTEQI